MNTVEDILREKGSRVHTVGPEATVYDAIERMVAVNIGALVVMDGASIAGILTERDYLRRVALRGRSSKSTAVRDIMTHPIIFVTLDTPVSGCMRLMTERRIRHLPVVEATRMVGIISIGDVVKLKLRDQSDQIQHLTDYIQGASVTMYSGA